MFPIFTETVERFWHVHFQTFVRTEYNWPSYEVADEYDYPHNGSYYEFDVDGESELLDIGDDRIVAEWIRTGETSGLDLGEFADEWVQTGTVGVRHVLHRLFKEGKIHAGKYMMEYNW
jgi:hypothetical protein